MALERGRQAAYAPLAADAGDMDRLGRHDRDASSRSAASGPSSSWRSASGRRVENMVGELALPDAALPSAATSAGSGGTARGIGASPRVELAVVRLRLVVGDGGDERLDDRGEAGRAPNVGLLVHDAHLERPVLGPRPRVPVAARVVSGRRLLPRSPVGKQRRRAARRHEQAAARRESSAARWPCLPRTASWRRAPAARAATA